MRPDDVVGLLRDALQRPGLYTAVEIIAETATHCRWAQFDPEAGVITFAITGWPLTEALRARALAELRRVLVATAAWSIYGRIRRTWPYINSINDLEYGYSWPEPPSNPIPAGLRLRLITERGAVPDAFGIQLLSPPLAATGLPHDASWVSTRLDTGHVLLEHRDLDAWFTDAHPDARVLDQARTDLARLIRPTRNKHHES